MPGSTSDWRITGDLSEIHFVELVTLPFWIEFYAESVCCPEPLAGLADDIRLRPLYWLTMLLALAGAALTTELSPVLRGWGFFAWIFSNGYLLYHFAKDKNVPMILLFTFYEIFNLRGVINNW